MDSSIILKYRKDLSYYVHAIFHSLIIFIIVIFTPLYLVYTGVSVDKVIKLFFILSIIMSYFIYQFFLFISFRNVIIDDKSVIFKGIHYNINKVDIKLLYHNFRSYYACFVRIYYEDKIICKFVNDSFLLDAQAGIKSEEIINFFYKVKNGTKINEIIDKIYLDSKQHVFLMKVLKIVMIKLLIIAPLIIFLMDWLSKKSN